MIKVAEVSKRYIGSFYWNAYHGHWDRVLDAEPETKTWTVAEVDLEGTMVKRPRKHQMPLNVRHFAAKPFRVTKAELDKVAS